MFVWTPMMKSQILKMVGMTMAPCHIICSRSPPLSIPLWPMSTTPSDQPQGEVAPLTKTAHAHDKERPNSKNDEENRSLK